MFGRESRTSRSTPCDPCGQQRLGEQRLESLDHDRAAQLGRRRPANLVGAPRSRHRSRKTLPWPELGRRAGRREGTVRRGVSVRWVTSARPRRSGPLRPPQPRPPPACDPASWIREVPRARASVRAARTGRPRRTARPSRRSRRGRHRRPWPARTRRSRDRGRERWRSPGSSGRRTRCPTR